MKNIFIFLLGLSISYQAHALTLQTVKSAVATREGAGVAAVIGSYLIPAGLMHICSGTSMAWLKALPAAAGAGIACLLHQKDISTKWGCNNATWKGSIASMATCFVCAFLTDAIVQKTITQQVEIDEAFTRSALTTLGTYVTLATRDSIIK